MELLHIFVCILLKQNGNYYYYYSSSSASNNELELVRSKYRQALNLCLRFNLLIAYAFMNLFRKSHKTGIYNVSINYYTD